LLKENNKLKDQEKQKRRGSKVKEGGMDFAYMESIEKGDSKTLEARQILQIGPDVEIE
jgi:hypothetical protein